MQSPYLPLRPHQMTQSTVLLCSAISCLLPLWLPVTDGVGNFSRKYLKLVINPLQWDFDTYISPCAVLSLMKTWPPYTITSVQPEIGQDNEHWLTGCMEMCRPLTVCSYFTYSDCYWLTGILLYLLQVMLIYWGTVIFLLKSDIRWTCALQKLYLLLAWKFFTWLTSLPSHFS